MGYWNLDDDYGSTTITNKAVINDNSALIAPMMNGTITSFVGVNPGAPTAATLASMWKNQTPRWPGKASITFTPANTTAIQFPSTENRLATILKKTKQITIAAWISNAPTTQNSGFLTWVTNNGSAAGNAGRGFQISVPFSGNVGYWISGVGTVSAANQDGGTSFSIPGWVNTQWQLWVFTKDATGVALDGTGATTSQVYCNGRLVTSFAGTHGFASNLDSTPFNSVAIPCYQSGLAIGISSLNGWYQGTFDELGIWDRVLSDDEIQSMYSAGAP